MTNDELRDDILEQDIEESEEVETETDETVDEEDTSEDTDWEAEAKKWKAIAQRNKKKIQAEAPKKIINKTNTSPNSIEETVLKAQGVSQEELDVLKKVSALNGISIIDAQKDDMFVLWKQKKEAEERQEKARLGASKGASQKAEKISFNTPGLTKEQHKALWKEKMGIK